jgi:hypothetical protein
MKSLVSRERPVSNSLFCPDVDAGFDDPVVASEADVTQLTLNLTLPSPSEVPALPGEPEQVCPRRTASRGVVVRVRERSLGLARDLVGDLVNFSGDGLGVSLQVPVVVGDEVLMELTRPGTSWSVGLTGEVRWCEPAPDGMVRAGVQLHRPLTSIEVTHLST